MTRSAKTRQITQANDIIYPAALVGGDTMVSPQKRATQPNRASLLQNLWKHKDLLLLYTSLLLAILLSIAYHYAAPNATSASSARSSKGEVKAFVEELLHPKLIQLKETLWANEQTLLELKQRSDAETHPEAALEENLRRITQTLNSAAGGDEAGSVSVEEIEKAVEQIKSRMAYLEELQERVADTYEDLERRAEAVGKSSGDVDAAAGEAESSDDFLSVDEAKKIIQDAIEKFRTDGVGLSDFALATLGATVERRFGLTSSSYVAQREAGTMLERVRDFFFFPFPKPAETAIQSDNSIGNCWACKIPHCNLTVTLVRPISPAAVSIDHISPKVAYNIESAPKLFRVYGARIGEDAVEEEFLGEHEYKVGEERTQTFEVDHAGGEAFSHVKLQILSNHGHKEYTCLYRFRVHEDLPED